MDETRQAQLSDINDILRILKSIVSQSFMSKSESKSQIENHQEAVKMFPVISCFAKVIHFVNEGSVHVPQVLLRQFLEVAKILNIVHESVKEDYDEDLDEDVGNEDPEDEVDDEDLDEGDEEIRDNLWWDDAVHQYQLYWVDDDDEDGDDVFATEQTEEGEEDFSIADRVKARRARLGASTGDDWIQRSSTSPTPRRWPTPATSSPPPPPRSTSPRSTACSPSPRRDPFISALLRTINRTAPKSVFSTKRAEILRKERSDTRVASIVPEEFRSLWDSADTEDEVENVNNTVSDPYPVLDWTKVNSRFLSNIPKPVKFPIHGCSLDPAIYEWTHVFHYPEVWGGTKENVKPKFVTSSFPFGAEWGYSTSAGIISVANVIHHGYIWNNGNWILHAQQPGEEKKETIKKQDKPNFHKKIKGKKEPHRTRP